MRFGTDSPVGADRDGLLLCDTRSATKQNEAERLIGSGGTGRRWKSARTSASPRGSIPRTQLLMILEASTVTPVDSYICRYRRLSGAGTRTNSHRPDIHSSLQLIKSCSQDLPDPWQCRIPKMQRSAEFVLPPRPRSSRFADQGRRQIRTRQSVDLYATQTLSSLKIRNTVTCGKKRVVRRADDQPGEASNRFCSQST